LHAAKEQKAQFFGQGAIFNPTWACTSADPREACSLFLREAASISADSSVKRGTVKSPAISSEVSCPPSSDFLMMSRIMERMHNTAGSFVQGDVKGMMQDARCRMQDARCRMQDARCRIQEAGCGNNDCGFRICFPVLLIFLRLCFRHARMGKGTWPLSIDSNGLRENGPTGTSKDNFVSFIKSFSFPVENANIGPLYEQALKTMEVT